MMKNKVYILGRGYVGRIINRELGYDFLNIPLGYKINSLKDLEVSIDRTYFLHPGDVIINCLGYTGFDRTSNSGNVDNCEWDLDKTLSSNAFLPIILAEWCGKNNYRLVHISSGCIYDTPNSKMWPNNADYNEEDLPNFTDLAYSRSKVYSELALNYLNENSKNFNILIPRIRIPLDYVPHPKNLLTKLLSFKRIINCCNSITYLPDFCKSLKEMIDYQITGLFNLVAAGPLYYKDLLDAYYDEDTTETIEYIYPQDLGLTRTNLRLNTEKLEENNIFNRCVYDIIPEVVKGYKAHEK